MQAVTPYKTFVRAEPPIKERLPNQTTSDTTQQRMRGAIHALARANDDLSRPNIEMQTVPGFSGFYAKMSAPVEKSSAVYHMTYTDPPGKTILNGSMGKLSNSVEAKHMPFAIIVGDYPVYKIMLDLKSENPDNFCKILPIMGAFHIQISFIYSIYKRFKGSGIDDVLVAAAVIVEGSVDQALCGKHFKRGVRCLRLFYETLLHHVLGSRLDGLSWSQEVKASVIKLRLMDDPVDVSDAHTVL